MSPAQYTALMKQQRVETAEGREKFRRATRKSKLKMRFKDNIFEEIARTAEKLDLLLEIAYEGTR